MENSLNKRHICAVNDEEKTTKTTTKTNGRKMIDRGHNAKFSQTNADYLCEHYTIFFVKSFSSNNAKKMLIREVFFDWDNQDGNKCHFFVQALS